MGGVAGATVGRHREGQVRHVRAIAVLLAGAVVVFGGVVALAALTVAREPPLSEQLPTDPTTGDGEQAAEEPPETLGALLEVTGERSGRFTTDRQGESMGDAYVLEGDDGRILIARTDDGEAFIDQMNWDGLDFFFDPGDCSLTPGTVNDDMGLVRTQISCTDVRDVRDTTTISLEGTANVPIGLVMVRDLPHLGGTLEVTGAVEETWTIQAGSWEPDFGGEWTLGMFGPDGNLSFSGERDPVPAEIVIGDAAYDIAEAACDVATTELAVVDPTTALVEVELACERVELEGVGTVSIEGTVVVTKIRFH